MLFWKLVGGTHQVTTSCVHFLPEYAVIFFAKFVLLGLEKKNKGSCEICSIQFNKSCANSFFPGKKTVE